MEDACDQRTVAPARKGDRRILAEAGMSTALIQLLDSDHGRTLQSWTFDDRDSITIGRAEDNDVVVADPYVSRSHALLRWENGRWTLTSVSRQLVCYQGELWGELALTDGTVFRLGPNGCYLRFAHSTSQEPANSKTMSYDASSMPIFELDREKVHQDVTQIAGGEYFQHLKAAAEQLRVDRESNASPESG
jgi:predicted component of type VI protein secretion system